MTRMLVAFEAPSPLTSETTEAAWDRWVDDLRSRGLEVVNDLDPVAVVGDIEVYEVVACV